MTDPDTNTLNGSLKQLGITMAANLTTMGVLSTYDEGLTTLAGKILNISPGPIPASISLTADKSILSYADSQSATLSATVLDEDSQAVEGVSVEFFNGSTSMGTSTTNSSGVATKSYSSSGAGDISFTAEVGSLVSERYDVQDCKLYDGATSNKLSQYTITRYANSFDTDHYVLQNTTNWSLNFLKLPLNDLSDFIFEMDMKVVSRGSNGNFGLMITKDSEISSSGVSNNRSELMDYTADFGMTMESQTVSGHLVDNRWYTLRYTVKNDGTVKGEIIDTTNNTTVFNQTVNDSSIISYLKQAYVHSRGTTNTIHIKNIKLKPL